MRLQITHQYPVRAALSEMCQTQPGIIAVEERRTGDCSPAKTLAEREVDVQGQLQPHAHLSVVEIVAGDIANAI